MSPNYIQKITALDINDIVLIEKKTYKNPWSRTHFENDIENKFSINYKFKKNNELIAYMFGYLIDDEYQLNKITVKEKYRENNIGNLLFNYCLTHLLNKNVKIIQLEVSSLNLVAQKFYKNLKFRRVGVREKYYSNNEDAFLYNLEIK